MLKRTKRGQTNQLLWIPVAGRTQEEVHTLVRPRLEDREQLHAGHRVREHRAHRQRADLQRQETTRVEQHTWHDYLLAAAVH